MFRSSLSLAVLMWFSVGCGHRYTIVGESDTNKPIGVSIMKTRSSGDPTQLYYTELTGNDTTFHYDKRITEPNIRVEAWFEFKDRPGPKTVCAVPPDERIRVKVDTKDDRVVVEETKYGRRAEEEDDD